MIRKATAYNLALFAWALLVAGAAIAIWSGNAEPYVSPSQVPGGAPHMFGSVVGGWLLGALVVGGLKTRGWKAAGRAAGLRPQGGGLFGKPDLVGTVHGQRVRARTRKKRTSGGGESGSSTTTFTVVEAELSEFADEGLILGYGSSNVTGMDHPAPSVVTVDGEFHAVGASEELLRELLTPRVRDALREMGDVEGLLVGDAAGMLSDAFAEMTESRLFSSFADKALDEMPGDASWVSIERKGLVLSGGELSRRIELVATVADAFEGATSGQE